MQKQTEHTKTIIPYVLTIDTSCDETSVAVVNGTRILSNIVWSQASLHAKWGGVVPSIAQREHIKRIGWVVDKAINKAFPKSKQTTEKIIFKKIDAIAVTAGPCLAVAGEVGIRKAKELSKTFNKPLITVNHMEGHLLSPLATPKTKEQSKTLNFPTLGIAASGGHTQVVYIKKIGDYKIIAQTIDDALGESLDKSARLLGFGYPGGSVLEKVAKEGNPKAYDLPIPLLGREKELHFSYSGLKTAFYRLIENETEFGKKTLTKKQVANLAASYQLTAFKHFLRVVEYILKQPQYGKIKQILAGGGVMANITLRKMLRESAKKYDIEVLYPYSKKLYTDNAAMVGVAASFKFSRGEFVSPSKTEIVDRIPRASVDKHFPWE